MKQHFHNRPKDTVGRTEIQIRNRADIFLQIELESRNERLYSRISSPKHSISYAPSQLTLSPLDLDQIFERIVSAARKSSEMPKSTFRSIAEEGYDLFCRIFEGNDEVAQDLVQWITERSSSRNGEDLAALVSGYLSPPRILIVADGINVPWELLYAVNPSQYSADGTSTEIDPKFFLGCNFVFQKHLRLEKSRASYTAIMNPSEGASFFLGDRLRYAEPIERKEIESEFLRDGRRFTLEEPFPPNTRSGPRDLVAKRINATTDPILHFACHAAVENGRAVLRLREGYFQEQLPLLQALNERPPGGTFVFLNACELSVRRSGDYCGIVNGLMAKGVAMVISTLIPVSDHIAALFSHSVYKYFLSSGNRSLLDAVFLARRRILEDQGSLVGLTYSTYGSWDLIRS